MGSLYQTGSFVTACISLVRSQTNRDGANSRRLRNHVKKSGDAVHRLGTILQSIFCAQSTEPAFAWPSGNGPVRVCA